MELVPEEAVSEEDEEEKETQLQNEKTSGKTQTMSINIPSEPIYVDATRAAWAVNADITKLSSTHLSVIAHRAVVKPKFLKCHFCGKYERMGVINCSKCNSSLSNTDEMKSNLLNEDDDDSDADADAVKSKTDQNVDEFLDCCDKCMNNFVYGCIYLSIFAVLFVFPFFEIVSMAQHWDNYGGCSVYFQYLLLSKLLITLFLYTLIGIHYKLERSRSILTRGLIMITGLLLFFGWLICASIVFWGDDNFDHSHCNAHDVHTADYYDFMFVEIMLVYAMFAFITSYFSWITISRNEKIIKCIVYSQAFTIVVCVPAAVPLIEIIMLIIFWDNHGHCSDKFEWYILVKVVFMISLFIVFGGLFCYFRKNKDIGYIRNVIINVIICISYLFFAIWGFMAAALFFTNAYNHE